MTVDHNCSQTLAQNSTPPSKVQFYYTLKYTTIAFSLVKSTTPTKSTNVYCILGLEIDFHFARLFSADVRTSADAMCGHNSIIEDVIDFGGCDFIVAIPSFIPLMKEKYRLDIVRSRKFFFDE